MALARFLAYPFLDVQRYASCRKNDRENRLLSPRQIPDTSATARRLMDRGKFRALPVLEDDKLIGIVTDRDLRKHEGLAGKAAGYLEWTKVTAAMTPDPTTISPGSGALNTARLLLKRKIGAFL
jgi:CBS domain-containing protein